MEITLAVLADHANITTEGRLNLLGVFSRISALSVPVQYPHMTLAAVIRATTAARGTKHTVRVVAADRDGKPLVVPTDVALAVPDALPGPEVEMHLLVGFLGMTFPHYGPYSFDIFIDGYSKSQVVLEVIPSANTPQ